MTQFTAHGPFPIPTEKLPVGRTIGKADIQKFWGQNEVFSTQKGVYVFAMRAGGGITPMYVGKATKSFGQEAFATHKINKYLLALGQYKKGTPVMFFLAYPPKSGAANLKHIAAAEKFLIQQGVVVNPTLLNIVHAKVPKWGITGALRSKTKKPTKEAKVFRGIFALGG